MYQFLPSPEGGGVVGDFAHLTHAAPNREKSTDETVDPDVEDEEIQPEKD